MKKSYLSLATLLVSAMLFLLINGCESKKAASVETVQKPLIAVSIVPEKTFVEAVCGDLAEVVAMIPPGSSPTNYEPTPQEMAQFSKAKVYFAIGVNTETVNIMPKAKEISDLQIVKLNEEAAKVYPEREFSPGNRDPHIWLSPKRAKVMVESIAKTMIEIDSANSQIYTANAQSYISQLDSLDLEIKAALSGVKDKKMIVFHPAFGYLADDYGISMIALEENGKEATPQRLKEMIDLAKKENIKAIFYQAEVAGKQAQSFADEIGGKTVQLAPLSADYIGNLKKMAKLLSEVLKEGK